MNSFARLFLLSSLLVSAASVSLAQAPATDGPSNILVIQREYLKPGKTGSVHARTESAFIHAMTAAKWPTHYIGMDSQSGPSRALFLVPYDSMEAWEKDNAAMDSNATLGAAWDHAEIADGELLTSFDQSVWHLRKDLSLLTTPVDIANMRYFEILQFHTKPGHEQQFEELVKTYVAAFSKDVPGATWAVYSNIYGNNDNGVYLTFFPRKSLAEVDKGFDQGRQVMSSLGASGLKRIAELTSDSVSESQTNLFHFNPRLSYPDEHFTSTDPGFWKPKPTSGPKPAAQ